MIQRILATISSAAVILLLSALCIAIIPATSTQAQEPLPDDTAAPSFDALADLNRIRNTPEEIAAIAQFRAEYNRVPKHDNRLSPRANASHFEIPMTIKVGITGHLHCGAWLSAGQPIKEVLEMDFKEYVKNVVPNEWINTWHPESLKSGAIAAKSFAWRHMATGFPRPQGVDIVDNTCDQVFIRNSRRATTDAAVDETWHYRISVNNYLTEIHYLSTDAFCEQYKIQYGWQRCMGQWGTQYKALDGWSWQSIVSHYYAPILISVTNTLPPNTNVVANGKFELGMNGWYTWGGIQGAGVNDQVLSFYRRAGSTNPAVVYQDLDYRVPQNTPLRATVFLGNSSNVAKNVTIHLRRSNSWDGAISCVFTLLPDTPMQKYTVFGTNPAGWVGVRVEVQGESDDGLPAYLVDKVKVVYKPKGKPDDVPNCDAPRPGKPIINSPVANTVYDHTQLTLNLTEGDSNLRPYYAAAYHIQLSTSTTFSTVLWDNHDALATETQIPLTRNGTDSLTNGKYYLRVRQFDGIDRYSRWSKVIPFEIAALPQTPTLLSPINETPTGDGLRFSWSKIDNVDQYKIVIKDAQNVKIGKGKFTPIQASCNAEQCSVSAAALNATFTTGETYTWKLVIKNSHGKSKANGQFTITDATVTPTTTATSTAPDALAPIPAEVTAETEVTAEPEVTAISGF